MDEPLLRVEGVTKRFGHVEALRGVDLQVNRGEVTGLIGDNGAGKSTLVKILAGTEMPDAGEIRIGGDPVRFSDPIGAREAGVETVYQDLALAPDLDAAANLFLGRELKRTGPLGWLGWIDQRAMRDATPEILGRIGVKLKDPREPIATYSGGQQQGVAVARAAAWANRVLILDEPTAALGVTQTHNVLAMIDRVRASGIAVILVSHNLPDVLEICDRITVLRLGLRVADISRQEATTEMLVGAMTGAEGQSTSQGSEGSDD